MPKFKKNPSPLKYGRKTPFKFGFAGMIPNFRQRIRRPMQNPGNLASSIRAGVPNNPFNLPLGTQDPRGGIVGGPIGRPNLAIPRRGASSLTPRGLLGGRLGSKAASILGGRGLGLPGRGGLGRSIRRGVRGLRRRFGRGLGRGLRRRLGRLF